MYHQLYGFATSAERNIPSQRVGGLLISPDLLHSSCVHIHSRRKNQRTSGSTARTA